MNDDHCATKRYDCFRLLYESRSIWDRIQSISQIPTCNCQGCKCNLNKKMINLREKEWFYDFLMGLNEEFNVVKTQFLSSSSVPTLGTVYHLVSQDEQQRII